jgi:DNA-binding transcriptional ArsR family regulator
MKNNAKKLVREQLAIKGNDNEQIIINYGTIKRAALTLRAVNHTLRKKLLEVIQTKGEVNVTDIYSKLKIEQSVASQHLAIMRRAGLLTTRREGKQIYYSINKKRLAGIVNLSQKLAQDTV